MTAGGTARKERAGAAGVALVVEAVLGLALVYGLAVTRSAVPRDGPVSFALAPPPVAPPPRPPAARHAVAPRAQGAAAPPHFRATPTEIVAPLPIVMPAAPPIVAAPVAGTGSDAAAGAADVAGPGTGSGGTGTGRGAGGRGAGDGGGGGDETPPRRRAGRLKDSDYPRAAGEAGAGGTVSVRYTVTAAGRAAECRVTRSSGNAALDATTCNLIERRFRFDPSRDAHGRPVASTIVENHSWAIAAVPAVPER